jgi:hypothetical protein
MQASSFSFTEVGWLTSGNNVMKTLGFVPQENGKPIHAMAKGFRIVMEHLLPFTTPHPSIHL